MSENQSSPSDVPLVRRSTIQRKLAKARYGPATLIHAPAGYGKTHILDEWSRAIEEDGVTVVRMRCDPSMHSPARFFGTLSSLVTNAASRAGYDDTVELVRNRSIATFAGSLLARLRRFRECIVVIDSYEAAASEGVDEIVAELVQCAPAHVHFAIASRVEPDLGLARQRMVGEVTVLDLADLRLTDAEITTLFPAATPEFIARLSVMTEGWPFAVHLAAIHASMISDDIHSAEMLITSDKDLGDFMSDAMLRNLPPDHCQLLLETSFLPVLDVDVVEAVTGLTDGWQKLTDLKRANILTVAAEAASQSFRCHPLLRTYLYRQLRARGLARMQQLQARAVEYFRAMGDYKAAARHARNLGDVALSTDLFLESGAVLINFHQGHGGLQEALDQLPREAFHHPRVRAAQACVLAKRGQPEVARLMLEDIDVGSVHDDAAKLARRDINIAILTTAAYSARGLLAEDWERFAFQRVGSEREIAAVEGFYYNLRWGIDFNDCDMTTALVHGRLAAHHYGTAGASNGSGHIHIHLARTLTELGRLNEALADLARAREYFTASSDFGALALVDIFEARCNFLRGDLTDVDVKVGPALRTLQEGEHYWEPVGVGYVLLADAKLLHGDGALAVKHLACGIEFAHKRNMLQLEAVLGAKLMMLYADPALGGDVESSQNLPRPDTLQLRDQAQWLERFLHRRLKACLLAREGLHDDAGDLLAAAAADANAAALVAMEIECLLDHVMVSEAQGNKAQSLKLALKAVDLCSRTGLIASFMLRSKSLLPLLVQMLNDHGIGAEANLQLFIRHLISQCSGRSGSNSAIFSPREKAILELLAASKCNKEIARELDISPETVRFHLKRVYEKLGVGMGYHNRKFVREIILESRLV